MAFEPQLPRSMTVAARHRLTVAHRRVFCVLASREGLTPSPTCPSLGKVASAKAGCGRSGNQTGTPPVSPPRCAPMEGFYMSTNIFRLLPDQERALLECYVTGPKQPASFQQLFDTMKAPTDAVPDRLQKGITV